MTTETMQEAATRYRQKSADVEARQLIDDLRNHTAIAAWIESGGGQAGIPFAEPCLYVETVDGQKRADIGDWIVRFPAGTFQVVPGDKFDAGFEPATDDELARLRARLVQAEAFIGSLERITTAWTRGMYSAWIDCRRGDTKAATECLAEGLDGYDGPEWDGTEAGAEWRERTKAEEGL